MQISIWSGSGRSRGIQSLQRICVVIGPWRSTSLQSNLIEFSAITNQFLATSLLVPIFFSRLSYRLSNKKATVVRYRVNTCYLSTWVRSPDHHPSDRLWHTLWHYLPSGSWLPSKLWKISKDLLFTERWIEDPAGWLCRGADRSEYSSTGNLLQVETIPKDPLISRLISVRFY